MTSQLLIFDFNFILESERGGTLSHHPNYRLDKEKLFLQEKRKTSKEIAVKKARNSVFVYVRQTSTSLTLQHIFDARPEFITLFLNKQINS